MRCIVAADTKAEAQWPPGITADIRFVDPRFFLVNGCYRIGIAWNTVVRI